MNNWELPAVEVVKKLPADILSHTKIVGKWVWVTFESNPGRDTVSFLRDLGFHWNRTRACWQHSGGMRTGPAKGYDPRDKYQVMDADKLAAA